MSHFYAFSPNRTAQSKNARYTRVTAIPRGFSASDVPQATLDKRARKLLKATYQNYKGHGGWAAVARHFKIFTTSGEPNKALVYLMAHGQRPICESLRRIAFMANKKDFRRFVRNVAVPWLIRNWRT